MSLLSSFPGKSQTNNDNKQLNFQTNSNTKDNNQSGQLSIGRQTTPGKNSPKQAPLANSLSQPTRAVDPPGPPLPKLAENPFVNKEGSKPSAQTPAPQSNLKNNPFLKKEEDQRKQE